MKVLLGATCALLLGALVMSWQGMNHAVRNAPAAETERLREQVRELRADLERIQLEKQYQQIRAGVSELPLVSNAEMEQVKAQLAAQQEALAQMEAAASEEAAAERDAQLEMEEGALLDQRRLESKDTELRRARMIAEALLIGTVSEYVSNPEYGDFVTFQIHMPEQVQVGTILAIRRKTGILCQLKVSDVSPEGGIANPLPGFGPVEPIAGDELILPPPF
ncbi:MAG: hypothetical protein ACO3RV_07065 [Luteolibacter sp.]